MDDEWHRGNYDINDWDFGLTTRARRPKPALDAVRKAFAEVPFPSDRQWPKISVIVCSYNGARTIRDCFDGLRNLRYPNFEVIVVNDGSKDRTAAIANEYGFKLINTENRGLSSARNTGAEAATGEIVAYTDDDAYPDPDWLTYLASTFMSTDYVGVGGPNIAPPEDGEVAKCVAHAPGGPVHVLLTDREAEHIPGCNMAFRKSALMEVGGFDPRFRTAGDDVDVCWQLQKRGWKLGFNPAAMVWHHRRNLVRAYWKQQREYGRAEALLEEKWPEKYNGAGQVTWIGRLYGNGLARALGFGRGRIYHGSWGTALFQSIYQPAWNGLGSLPLMPEWYLLVWGLVLMSALGFSWRPLFLTLPLLLAAVSAVLLQAVRGAARAPLNPGSLLCRGLVGFLYLQQPLARLIGRVSSGLTIWRRRGHAGIVRSWSRPQWIWSEQWRSSGERLSAIEQDLRRCGAVVRRGGDFDRWDLEVRGGLFGGGRMLMGIEDHGAGKQLVRFRTWPKLSPTAILIDLVFALLTIGAAAEHALIASIGLYLIFGLFSSRLFTESAAAQSMILCAIHRSQDSERTILARQSADQPGPESTLLNPEQEEAVIEASNSVRATTAGRR